mmetsp:Transcript_73554/g.191044  ORF Transcript_73554/g.191044 Transcript_73554/m.191044 type:complete len:111 (-) Transcript_73554:97-429(-)
MQSRPHSARLALQPVKRIRAELACRARINTKQPDRMLRRFIRAPGNTSSLKCVRRASFELHSADKAAWRPDRSPSAFQVPASARPALRIPRIRAEHEPTLQDQTTGTESF